MVVEHRHRALSVRGISEISVRAQPYGARPRHRRVKERSPVPILVRSIAFNLLFYLNTFVYLMIALPTFIMPYRAILAVAKSWGRANLVLLRVVAGIDFELRGREKIPQGPIIVAAKHQSAWETFALLSLFDNPLFIVKRELLWLPLFGWLMMKGRMVPVDRGAGSQALVAMTGRASIELADNRQLIIFPEGTRRPAGAEPRYKYGVAQLYAAAGVPCVPIALNSGLFWPRRSIRRLPGTVVVEILDPIAPGFDKDVFFKRLQQEIETATARLIAEAQVKSGR
ncbi:MAG: 1-acyl-sn-glycerol-3-phosphate acyltransferase [Pseudolabrys sp.]|nr:1-acyl-sn-glycerol-3-phosphate acyltransferase [Pseudolabrys sp.]